MHCLKCKSLNTVKNGRDLKSDRPFFLCHDCGYRWRAGTATRYRISERERDYWNVWRACGEKAKAASRQLRDPNSQPCYARATPEHVRKVIARVQSKLKLGLEFPDKYEK